MGSTDAASRVKSARMELMSTAQVTYYGLYMDRGMVCGLEISLHISPFLFPRISVGVFNTYSWKEDNYSV